MTHRRRINATHPINFASPHARNLTHCWMVLPNRVGGGGNVFRDLCRRRHGDFVTGPTWAGDGIDFAGSGRINIGDADSLDLVAPFTIGALYRHSSTSSGYLCGKIVGSWDYNLDISQGGQVIRFSFSTNAGSSPNVAAAYGGGVGDLDKFNGQDVLVLGSYDGANARIFVQGTRYSSSVAETGSITTTTDGFAIGERGTSGGGGTLTGSRIKAVFAWKGRAFLGPSADALYADMRLGFPQLLNWLRPPVAFEQAGGGAPVGATSRALYLALLGAA